MGKHHVHKTRSQFRVYLWDSQDIATVFTEYYYRDKEDPFRVFGYSRPLNLWQLLCRATTYDYHNDEQYWVHYI